MDLWRRDASKFTYSWIDTSHVEGLVPDSTPAKAGEHYVRLWLAEMFLQRDRDWFRSWHPLVHSSVRLLVGGNRVEIPYVAGSLNLPDIKVENLQRAVRVGYPLTGLLPFNGGIVEMEAGLFAVRGNDMTNRIVKVLGDFATLLVSPPLSAAIGLASKIASGVEEVLDAGEGQLHLGIHDSFTGNGGPAASQLREGYIAAILATEDQVEKDRLWVTNSQLRYQYTDTSRKPFNEYTYMLFRIEKRLERDDWASLIKIQEPLDTAVQALVEGDENKAEIYRGMAIATALASQDLTALDRIRVVKAIDARIYQVRELVRKPPAASAPGGQLAPARRKQPATPPPVRQQTPASRNTSKPASKVTMTLERARVTSPPRSLDLKNLDVKAVAKMRMSRGTVLPALKKLERRGFHVKRHTGKKVEAYYLTTPVLRRARSVHGSGAGLDLQRPSITKLGLDKLVKRAISIEDARKLLSKGGPVTSPYPAPPRRRP